jgi:hypothetical protein
MAGIVRRERDGGCSYGVGGKLAKLWKEKYLNVRSFVGDDGNLGECSPIDQSELESGLPFRFREVPGLHFLGRIQDSRYPRYPRQFERSRNK